MKPRKNNTDGSSGDVASLTFHGWSGRFQERTRAKTTEKGKGVMMMDRIKDRFGLTALEIEEHRVQIREKELKDFEDMKQEARARTERQINWTRDEEGKIISPFDRKPKRV